LRLQGLPEEEFGCRYIATRTQSEINGPAFPVHGSVKIPPDAADLDIRLVNAPGIAGLAGKTVPAPLEFRRKALHPAHDRGMGQRQATLGQIPKAQLEAKIPPHAEDDDLAFKVPTLEQLIKAVRRFQHFSNPMPTLDPYYQSLKICTRAIMCIFKLVKS
jgi:hypothetical protein